LTAYDILKERKMSNPITWEEFYGLIAEFRNRMLEEENYLENLELYREPREVKIAMLQKLRDAHRDLQQRPEMRDNDEKTRTQGYVPSVIREIWKSDKRIKSLYRAIEKYTTLRQKDFSLIAIHIAEYRAINKLLIIVEKNLHRKPKGNNKRISPVIYVFDDWLNNNFCEEKMPTGEYVANDSNKYSALVAAGKMSADTRKKIELAQQQTYEYLVNHSLRVLDQAFEQEIKNNGDSQQLISNKLEEISLYLKKHQVPYKFFLDKMRELIRPGARFILPAYYSSMVQKQPLHFSMLPQSPYSLTIAGISTTFPTEDQLVYVMLEIQVRWMKLLQAKKDKRRLEEMLSGKDFKELIDRYGETDKLLSDYKKGLGFAPDRERYIQKRIETYESVLPKFQSSIHAWDKEFRQEIQIQTGEYRRIGFAWVNNGHNAQSSDLHTITYSNTIASNVPSEGRYSIFANILYQLATGGAIAFHVAYLRKQLQKTTPSTKRQQTKPRNIWQGTEAQRTRLFDELAEEGFVKSTFANKNRFLKNKTIQWLQDGRSLFYLLEELKRKIYGALNRYENLGPLIRDNFLNRNGQPYKNVSQNKSGMHSINKASKPRLGNQIDTILASTFKS
jgi:hypothetical protein